MKDEDISRIASIVERATESGVEVDRDGNSANIVDALFFLGRSILEGLSEVAGQIKRYNDKQE